MDFSNIPEILWSGFKILILLVLGFVVFNVFWAILALLIDSVNNRNAKEIKKQAELEKLYFSTKPKSSSGWFMTEVFKFYILKILKTLKNFKNNITNKKNGK